MGTVKIPLLPPDISAETSRISTIIPLDAAPLNGSPLILEDMNAPTNAEAKAHAEAHVVTVSGEKPVFRAIAAHIAEIIGNSTAPTSVPMSIDFPVVVLVIAYLPPCFFFIIL